MQEMGLQHTATRCNTLQHVTDMTLAGEDAGDGAATHCNTLQHTVTHCKTLQNTTDMTLEGENIEDRAATHCNTLQHTTDMTLAGEDAGDGAG